MKKIPEPQLSSVETLSAAEMNKIHFGGNHTPLSPKDIKNIATGKNMEMVATSTTSTAKDLK